MPVSLRTVVAIGLAGVAVACAPTTPPPPPTPPVVPLTWEEKLASMVRLEDQRMLRDATPVAAPAPPPARGRRQFQAALVPVKETPDLIRMLGDAEPRARRRAALAIGRVRLAEGVPPLVTTLKDPDVDVRQMAAFGLGLIGDRAAVAPLNAALADPEPMVQGRAAEALGLIGDASAAPAIAQMVYGHVLTGVLASIGPDDEAYPLAPPVEAIRLGVYALTRLKAYEPLASAILGRDGLPVTRWWPVAYAFSRIEDRRALAILMSLASGSGRYTVAFAARGLGSLKDPGARKVLLPLVNPDTQDPRIVVAAIRALAQIGGDAPKALVDLLRRPQLDPNIRLEAVIALGTLRTQAALELVMDLVADPWPSMRAAALRALAQIDQSSFVLVLSGLDADPHWSVRASLASTLGLLDLETARPRLAALVADEDRRVVPAALVALAKLGAPEAEALLLKFLRDGDPVVRMTAARELGELRPASGAQALAEAYRAGTADTTYVARAAALTALARYGAEVATDTLRTALADRDWAVRLRAAELLKELDPAPAPAPAAIRPAPGAPPPGVEVYAAPDLIGPPYSPHVFIDTDKGTIEIELAVLDAPITVRTLMALARKGFFSGVPFHRIVPNFVAQGGDPRGDGEGGPGYTIRDELSERPYLRGTVGIALDWADTGGSQFFITHSPQPHLDARYTVIGHVVAGMEVVDRLQQWDVVRRVRVWDGVSMSAK